MFDEESEDVKAEVKRCRDEEVAEDTEDNVADSEGQGGQAKVQSYQR